MDYKDIRMDKCQIIGTKLFHDNHILEFWTPTMYVPFGINTFNKEEYGEKIELPLSFRNEQGMHLKNFENIIEKLNKFVKAQFPEDYDFFPMIKNNCFMLRIPKIKRVIQTRIKSEKIGAPTIYDIEKGMLVRCLVRIDKIWNYGKRAGIIINVQEIIIL